MAFPLDAVIKAMTLVTTNNIFEWGDMYFIQLLNTATDTSSTRMWAIIYFDAHEKQALSVPVESNILMYKV
jgi:hypothetical protein